MRVAPLSPGRAGRALIPLFALLAVGITTAGYFSYRSYERYFGVEVEHQLSAVAELKVGELAQWRRERLADGSVFLGNAVFSGLVRRWFEAPEDSGARAQITAWLGKVQAAYHYEQVILLDARGVPRLSIPETPEPEAAHVMRDALDVLRSGRVGFLDLHRDAPGGPVHLAVLVPILEGAQHPRPLGVILLRIDPEQYLYPLLQRWPIASRTAETLLVRRDGTDVLFLNELRFQKNTAITLRSPLTHTNLPAVKAALGQEGTEDGVDYRGVPVVAAVRVVPDSPWSLVARMDAAEVYAPLRERRWMLVALVGLTLLATGAGFGFVWRQQEVRSAQERYQAAEALNESEERFRLAAESSHDLIYEWDLGQSVRWFGEIDELAGYAPGEFPRTLDGWADALHPEDRERVMAAVEANLAGRAPYAVEYRVRAGDGGYRWWSARGLALRLPDGTPRRWIGTITDITERKRAEEALREREAKYRTLAENIPQRIFMKDRSYRWVSINEHFARDLGLRAEDVIGKTDYDLFPKELADKYRADDARIMETGRTEEIEERTSLQGREPWVHTIKTPVRDEGGTIVGVLGVFSDITERKRAEEALVLQKRIAEIFLAVPDDEMFYEVLKVVLEVMDSRFGVFGYLDEAGALVVPTMTRDVWDKCQVAEKTITFPRDTWGDSSWPRAIRERAPNYSNEISTRTPEGHVSLRRHVSLPILLQGQVIGLFQVANKETDYTEADIRRLGSIAEYVAPVLNARLQRERTDEALRQSERKFRETIRSLDEGYYSVTPEGVLLDHNPAFNRILGLDPARDSRGAQLPDFWLRPDDRREYLRELAAAGYIRNYLIDVKTGRGDTAVVLASAHAVKDATDKVVRIEGTFTDYTDRKRAEDEILRLNAELEQRVVERTARLEAANGELEAFSYSVSHDLRAPLRHIDGYVALLLDRCRGELTDQGRHYVDTIADSARQMGRLIDDLLQMSRTGRAEMHEAGVDMNRTLREALDSLAGDLAGRSIEWVLGDLPPVRGDGAMLRLVWTNLLGNAIKYTRAKDQARIEVGFHEGPEETTFFVRDDGVGFDMRYAHKLFGVFQRLHSQAEFEGTGIGLATVRRIVSRHGGRTWAEGEVGAGAAFYFSVPRSGGEG